MSRSNKKSSPTFFVENFRAFGEYAEFTLAPLTILFGPNGGGKSSLSGALKVLMQSIGCEDLQPRGALVDYGIAERLMHNTDRPLRFGIKLNPQISSTFSFALNICDGKPAVLSFEAWERKHAEFGVVSRITHLPPPLHGTDYLLDSADAVQQAARGVLDIRHASTMALVYGNERPLREHRIFSLARAETGMPEFASLARARLSDSGFVSPLVVSHLSQDPRYWDVVLSWCNQPWRDQRHPFASDLQAMSSRWISTAENLTDFLERSLGEDQHYQCMGAEHHVELLEAELDELPQEARDRRETISGRLVEAKRFLSEQEIRATTLGPDCRSFGVMFDEFMSKFHQFVAEEDYASALKACAGSHVAWCTGFTPKRVGNLFYSELSADLLNPMETADVPRHCFPEDFMSNHWSDCLPVNCFVADCRYLYQLCLGAKPLVADRRALNRPAQLSPNFSGHTGIQGEFVGEVLACKTEQSTHALEQLKSNFDTTIQIKRESLDSALIGEAQVALLSEITTPSGREKTIPLWDHGFGQRQLLALLLDLQRRETFVLVEEPEVNLYPKLQAALADAFADAITSRDVRILAETHSISIFYRIQKLVRDGVLDSEDVSLTFVDCSQSPPARRIELAESGNMVQHPPSEFFDRFLLELE